MDEFCGSQEGQTYNLAYIDMHIYTSILFWDTELL